MPKKRIKALVFDAYGTLFDVHSVISACDQSFPGHGAALSQAWRAKQLEYTWLRSLMGRYKDFWQVTESALVFGCKSLGLSCLPDTRAKLMETYLRLNPFPEVQQALRALSGYLLAILSNGSPRMLKAAVESAGLKGTFPPHPKRGRSENLQAQPARLSIGDSEITCVHKCDRLYFC